MSDIFVEVTSPSLDVAVVADASIAITVDTTPQSAPVAGYNHTQASAATEWIINHNLGYYPTATAFSAGGVEMVGEVVQMSVNQTRIYFNSAVSGTARLA